MIRFDDIEYACLSDVGVRRSHNQDAHASLPANDPEQWRLRGHLFVVADGMGAHAVGELASKLAADGIPHLYSKHSQDGPEPALRKAFVETNSSIYARGQQNREFAGMGTTGTAMVLRPEGVWIGHVGDSRCYRVRNGKIEQLSFDHSLVWELARRQNKAPEELQGIPTNVIVRSLGPEPHVQVDVEGPHPLQAGDRFILCSDGLSGPVSDRELGAVVATLPPAEACRFLINLANLQGGPDNITAIVVHVLGHGPGAASEAPAAAAAPPRPPFHHKLLAFSKKIPWALLLLLVGIALAMIAIYLTAYEKPGEIPTFIGAAVALLSGLAGLMIQNVGERRPPAEEPPAPRAPQIYRSTSCVIDPATLHRLVQAVQTLEERIRERHWEADWDACRAHIEQGRRSQEQGDLRAAFREQCRAMLAFMEAVSRQRKKEESFKPLWDRAAV